MVCLVQFDDGRHDGIVWHHGNKYTIRLDQFSEWIVQGADGEKKSKDLEQKYKTLVATDDVIRMQVNTAKRTVAWHKNTELMHVEKQVDFGVQYRFGISLYETEMSVQIIEFKLNVQRTKVY